MVTPTDRFNGSSEARRAAGQAWAVGLVGFGIVFVLLMMPWLGSPGAIGAGLSGAVAALVAYYFAQRQLEQARRFYEEAQDRTAREPTPHP